MDRFRRQGLVLAVPKLADDLILAQPLLRLLLVLGTLEANVTSTRRAGLRVDKEVRILFDKSRVVLLLFAEGLGHRCI